MQSWTTQHPAPSTQHLEHVSGEHIHNQLRLTHQSQLEYKDAASRDRHSIANITTEFSLPLAFPFPFPFSFPHHIFLFFSLPPDPSSIHTMPKRAASDRSTSAHPHSRTSFSALGMVLYILPSKGYRFSLWHPQFLARSLTIASLVFF